MFKIRPEQMTAFSEAARQSFEDRMVVHLQRFFPAQCESLGEGEVRIVIRCGIERAREYGIRAERDVCKYVDIMFAFGRDFDRNPDFPWARRILKERDYPSPSKKIDHLYDTAMQEALKAHHSGTSAQADK